MRLQFHGAAGEVTGSLHRLTVGDVDVLLDCGLFQGHRAEANRLNREVPRWATEADALILSHAHIDHSGNIPTLVKRGFSGNIYCTPATRDLCSVMLRDAAMLQEQDARYLNKRLKREGSDERIEPLYTVDDAQAAVAQMISVPQRRSFPVAPGVTVTFRDAGHVLGSSLVVLDLQERGRRLRLLFTGDLGREELPLLGPPEIVEGVDVLMTESTYGDREHPDIEGVDEELARIVTDTVARGGRVFIPTFALERAQEVLFALVRLYEHDRLPDIPVYIDSPLAISITEIYKLHPESLAAEVRARLLDRADPFTPPRLRYVSDVTSSREVQDSGESCVVIAGAGMCEGGRILHHFARGLEDSKNSVILTGFMAQHTLGRRLAEGRKQVKVFGVEREVRARVFTLDALSAHADRTDLLHFAAETARHGNVRTVVLVHGEDAARRSLEEGLRERGMTNVVHALRGETLEL